MTTCFLEDKWLINFSHDSVWGHWVIKSLKQSLSVMQHMMGMDLNITVCTEELPRQTRFTADHCWLDFTAVADRFTDKLRGHHSSNQRLSDWAPSLWACSLPLTPADCPWRIFFREIFLIVCLHISVLSQRTYIPLKDRSIKIRDAPICKFWANTDTDV